MKLTNNLLPETVEATYAGIPIDELVEYIFTTPTFTRKEVETSFAIPRYKFDSMAKEMDEVGIFVRGENNARVRNPEFSRQDVSSILSKASQDGFISSLFRRLPSGHFSHLPSNSENDC